MDTPRTAKDYTGDYLTYGERMCRALERIATALELAPAESGKPDPAAFLSGLLFDLENPGSVTMAMPDTSIVTDPDSDIIDDSDYAEIPLPIAGVGIMFRKSNQDESFELWLMGPGGTVTPLEWRT